MDFSDSMSNAMQLKLIVPRLGYTKQTSKNKPIVLEFGAIVQHKENCLRAHSVGFLQTPAHRPLQCANIRPFRLPR